MGQSPDTVLNQTHCRKRADDQQCVFTLSLSAASSQPVTVNYATADGTATVGGYDYVANSGTLTFVPGETTKTITIVINPDRKKDADETWSTPFCWTTKGSASS